MKKTCKVSVYSIEFCSYTLVLAALGILAFGLHDALRSMTARDCDRGAVAACKSIGR